MSEGCLSGRICQRGTFITRYMEKGAGIPSRELCPHFSGKRGLKRERRIIPKESGRALDGTEKRVIPHRIKKRETDLFSGRNAEVNAAKPDVFRRELKGAYSGL